MPNWLEHLPQDPDTWTHEQYQFYIKHTMADAIAQGIIQEKKEEEKKVEKPQRKPARAFEDRLDEYLNQRESIMASRAERRGYEDDAPYVMY